MEKLKPIVKFVWNNFAPVVAFYVLDKFCNSWISIGVALAITLLEAAYKVYKKEEITTLFKFSFITTVGFGIVDLLTQQASFSKYESVMTNLITAGLFAATLRSGKPMIQQYYESRGGDKPMTIDRVTYFRWLTMVWVGYFVAKAGLYFWMSYTMTREVRMVVRPLVGSASFYAMMVLSVYGSKKIFPWLKKMGWLPEPEAAVSPLPQTRPVLENESVPAI